MLSFCASQTSKNPATHTSQSQDRAFSRQKVLAPKKQTFFASLLSFCILLTFFLILCYFEKIWQYQDGGWHDYDPAASDEVEKTYQLYEKEKATGRIIDVRAVRSGAWAYQIDFRQFTQQNIQHAAHTIRSIRRIWRAAR